jgi:hypothetical protein
VNPPPLGLELGQQPAQMGLERPHLAGLARAALVVEAEHVQGPVDQQIPQLLVERDAPPSSLALRGLHRKHDVTERGAAMRGAGTLEHGEGEHVGGARLPSVAARQFRDLGVRHQRHRELGVRAAQGA